MKMLWSVVGPMARPGACGPGPGLGIKYEFVLRAGPGLDIVFMGRAGPGPNNSICGPGPGRDSTSAAGPGRARAGPGPQITFAGRAWAQISGPCRTLVHMVSPVT